MPQSPLSLDCLSKRERQVLALIGEGLSIPAIAKVLNRSQTTIKSHRESLGRKLHVSTQVELARIAMQAGLAPLPDSTSVHATPDLDRLGELEFRHPTWKTLHLIDSATGSSTGMEFFRSLVEHLAETLEIKCVLVGRLAEPEGAVLRIIAAWDDHAPIEAFDYRLRGSPWEEAAQGGLIFHSTNVQDRFVDDIHLSRFNVDSCLGIPLMDQARRPAGMLMLLNDQPIKRKHHPDLILWIMSSRASLALDNLKNEEDASN